MFNKKILKDRLFLKDFDTKFLFPKKKEHTNNFIEQRSLLETRHVLNQLSLTISN